MYRIDTWHNFSQIYCVIITIKFNIIAHICNRQVSFPYLDYEVPCDLIEIYIKKNPNHLKFLKLTFI